MVAVVTGAGFGLERSSGFVLGSHGQLGQSSVGRAGDNVYINAANGNLLVQNTDEMLFGLGQDSDIGRTYNSLGAGGWQANTARRITGLTGAVNTAGGAVTRIAADGSDVTYAYDAALGVYVAKEGDGGYDTLSFSGTTWTWTDGATRTVELYDAVNDGRITKSTDKDGNALTFSYNAAGQLARVTTADGGYTALIYTGALLTQVVTTVGGIDEATGSPKTESVVYYGYDSSNRLSTVTIDLSPGDSSIADGRVYATTYAYDGASNRIASITQTDGSSLQIGYALIGLTYRVSSLTQLAADGGARVTTFAYDTTNRVTTVLDPLNQATSFTYDAKGQLVAIAAPPAVAGAASQVTQFSYNAMGDVLTVTSPGGKIITYGYDASGNRTSEVDAAGNTITRTFSAANQVLTETQYLVADPDGAGSASASTPITTRYAYNANNDLRYVVGGDGSVTEYRYDAQGRQTSAIRYAGGVYNISALGATASLSEATLNSWVTGLSNKDKSQRTDTTYDFRGNVATVTAYGKVLSSGAGDTSATTEITKTTYVYDQHGRLLTRQPSSATTAEVYAYDGLGRTTASSDFAGATSSIVFDDVNSRTIVTLANGLVQTSTFDLAGELISYSQAGAGLSTATTSYAYDADGRLRMTTDPEGQRRYSLYDNAGRVVADVGPDGALTEYVYNRDNRRVGSISYANKLSPATLASLVDSGGQPAEVDLASVRPAGATADRADWAIYDAAHRLIETIEASGAVTTYSYDGASRLVSSTAHATLLSLAVLAGFRTTPPTMPQLPAASANDRVTRNFYDNAGRRAGELDAEGYLTQIQYDAAGQAIHTVRSAAAVAAALRVSGTLAQLITSAGTSANDIHNWVIYDNRGFKSVTIDGEGDVARYHYTALGDIDQVITGQVVSPSTYISTPPTLANLPSAGSGVVLDTRAYTRNLFGQVLTQTDTLASGATQTATYVYDNMHRLVRQTLGSGADARTTNQTYDLKGRLTGALGGVGSATLAALGANPTAAQVATVYATYGTTYAYDDDDRLVAKTQANGVDAVGSRTLYYYDTVGRLAYEINPLGAVMGYSYNSFGQRLAVTAYATPIAATALAGLTGGTADAALAALITADPAADSTVMFGYDQAGQLVLSTDAMGSATNYAYDAFGDLTAQTDSMAAGVSRLTTRAYDRRGLLLSQTLDAATGGLQRTTQYGYDAFGRAVQTTNAAGQTSSAGYDRAGRVISTTDALGRTTTFTYDGRDNVLTRTDRTGAITRYAYTAFNQKITVTSPTGMITTTTNNVFGQTVSIVAGNATQTTWTYDAAGQVLTTTDGAGVVRSTYDAAGHLATIVDGRGVTTRFSYDAADRLLTQVVDDTGAHLVTTYQYDAKGQQVQVTDPAGVKTTIAFDLDGRKTAVVVDPGTGGLALTTTYDYDAANRVVAVTQGAGGAAVQVTRHVYDQADQRTATIVDPDGLNLTTTYAYDAAGNVVASTDATGATTRYVYDADNRQIYAVGARGEISANTYDAEGRLTSVRRYANPISQAVLTGLPLAITATDVTTNLSTSSSDEVAAYVYDGDGRLRYTVDAAAQVVAYSYDGAGNLLSTVQYAAPITPAASYTLASIQSLVASQSGASGNRVTRSVYDSANRRAFSLAATGAVTAYAYDANGNVTKVTQYAKLSTFSSDPTLASVQIWVTANTGAADHVTRTVYDAANRAVYSVDAQGYVSQQQYDATGQVITLIRYADAYAVSDTVTQASLAALLGAPPASAAITHHTYDAAGRLTDTIDAGGVRTHRVLDALGRITDVTVAYGTADAATTHNVYDAASRLVAQTVAYGAPEAATTTYTYDGVGRVLTIADADGVTITQVYDASGRVIQTTEPLDATTNAVTFNAYDAFGNLAKVTDPRGNVGYFYYDRLDRLILQIDPEGYATATTYTIGDQPASVTRYAIKATGLGSTSVPPTLTPDAQDAVTTFTYDKLDRLTAVRDAEQYSESYMLDSFGNRATVTNKLGGVTTNAYDKRGLLISETLAMASTRADGTVAAASVTNLFSYDARGNLTRKVEASGLAEQRTTTYGYDLRDRLVSTVGDSVQVTADNLSTLTATAPTQTNGYDARGNLVRAIDANGATTWSYYDRQNRKIAQVDARGALTTWTYDANGNLTSQKAYDDLTALPPASTGAPPVPANPDRYRLTTYGYDKANRRVSTTIHGAMVGVDTGGVYTATAADITERVAYDAAGNVVATTNANGVRTYLYYDKAGRNIGSVDALGYLTTRQLDQNGNVVTETRFATALAPGFSASTLPAAATSADDRITTFTYDRNGQRLTESRLNVASYSVGLTGALTPGATTATIVYTYNGLGEVTSKTEATGDKTTYAYDLQGRATSVTAPQMRDHTWVNVSPQTTFAYNGLGDITRTSVNSVGGSASLARVTTNVYGAGGRLASTTDASGFTQTFGYDAAGNLVKTSYSRLRSDGTSVTEARAVRYDALGQQIFQATATLNGSTWTFGDAEQTQYNAFGEVVAKGVNGGAQQTYAYDSAGRIWRGVDDDGAIKLYLYDAMGNQTLAIASSGTDLSSLSLADGLALLTHNGANAIGAAAVQGVTATITAYDARDQAIEVRQPFREWSTANATLIAHHKTYNAFGEVASETNASGGQTVYTYNTLGKVVTRVLPTVNATDETGAVHTISPTTAFYYDISGRQVATRDANGNLDTRQLLAGSGYDGEEALVTADLHPDGGLVQYGYDVFHDARTYINEVGAVETRSYDGMGRLISLAHASTANPLTFNGGTGADTFNIRGPAIVNGNGGADTFVVHSGFGSLVINANTGGAASAVLQFDASVVASSLTVSSDVNGNLIIINDIGDRIQVNGQFSGSSYGIGLVKFADGTTLDQRQLTDLATTGSAANRSLYGTAGADTFDSRGQAYYAQGNGGADTFIYNAGYGALEINQINGTNSVLRLGAGLTAANLTFSSDAYDNLIITGASGDLIQVTDQFYGAAYGVGLIQFADGSTLNRQQLTDLVTTGSATNRLLYGTSGADTFDSRGLASFAQGDGGADTFIYNVGYGALEINQINGVNSVLRLGAGLTAANLTFIGSSSGDLIIAAGGGDQIQLDSQLNAQYGVGLVQFADGTTLNRQQLIDLATAAKHSLYGTSGADTFDGQGRAYYAQGNGGADTFIYNAGYGFLEINQVSGPSSVLQLGAGLTAANLTFSSDGNRDLTIVGASGDRILIDDYFYGAAYGVGLIQFADGSTLDRQQVTNLVATGSSGNRRLYGSTGADTFDSHGQAYYADGNGGADTFIYNAGYGALEIDQISGGASSVLKLGAGLTAANLTFSSDSSRSLIITGAAGDRILVDDYFYGAAYGVGLIQFADGSTLDRQQLTNLVATGSSGNRRLYGSTGADTFDGHGQAYYADGNGGADTFIYNAGYGALEINQSSGGASSVLKLGAGLTASNLIFTSDGSNLTITGASGDQIKIDYFFYGASYGVGLIQFADGTTLNRQQITQAVTPTSPAGGTLNGTSSAETLDSGGLVRTVHGNGGSDTFIYNAGYGALEIDQYSGSASSVLKLGAGLTAANLTFASDSSNNLIIIGASGDRILVDSQFYNANYGVGLIQFADGSTLDRQQLSNLVTTGSSGNRRLYGGAGADTFDSHGQAYYAEGKGGGDTFLYNAGYGALEINQSGGTNSVLRLGAGLTAANLTFTSDNDDNLIIIGAAGDRIQIDDQFYSASYGVGLIQFADGTTLDRQQLTNLVTTGSITNPRLYGSMGADILDGHGQAYYANGNGGADTFIYNAGYGALEIQSGGTSVLRLGSGLTAANLTFSSDNNDNLIIVGATGDRIQVDSQFLSSYYGVGLIQFADGTTLNRQQLTDLVTTGSAAVRRLYGASGADTLDSRGLAYYADGNGGADTFIYNVGYGALEIQSGGTSVLRLGVGLTAANLTFSSDTNNNLIITGGAGDRIKIDSQFLSSYYGVGLIQFADGTTLNRQQLIDLVTTGSFGNRRLYGTSGADTFDSRGLAGYANGEGGADTFIYNAGYGALEISQYSYSGASVLKLGAGLTAANLTFSRDTNDALIITGAAGDRIKINNQFLGLSYGLAQIQFADGTTLDRQRLTELVTIGTSGNRRLYGSTGADTFDSHGKAYYAQGNGGDDTFIYNAGYGALEINQDAGSGAAGNSVLRFGVGITAAQLIFTGEAGSNLIITDPFGGRIRLYGQLTSTRYGVSQIQFADGSILDRQQFIGLSGNAASLIDSYSYDGLGQRIRHSNSQLGTTALAERTDYDRQGRVVSQIDFNGYATTYAYAYDSAMVTNGLGAFGGWIQTTTNTAGLTSTAKTDYFGRAVGGSDFGGHVSSLTYDKAGRLVQKTNNVGQDLRYTYFNTGAIASETNMNAGTGYPAQTLQTYAYDLRGSRIRETSIVTYTNYDSEGVAYQATRTLQDASMTYDALGRVISFHDAGQDGAHPVDIAYEYDANNNVRLTASTYLDLVSGALVSREQWNRYDSMNRFVTTGGQMFNSAGAVTQTRGAAGNTISHGATGVDLAYNVAGQRVLAVSAASNESYTYTAAGYLASVFIDGVLRVRNVRDTMGRLTSHSEYDAKGKVAYSEVSAYDAGSQVISGQTSTLQSDGAITTATTTYDYRADVGGGNYTGAYMGGVMVHSRTTATQIKSGQTTTQPTSDTANTYVWWDGAKQSTIRTTPDITKSAVNTSTFAYDSGGQVTSVAIQDGRPRTVNYVTNSAGQILSRQETSASPGNPVEYYYRFDNIQYAEIGNNGPNGATNYAASIAQRSAAAQSTAFTGGSAVSYADMDQQYDPLNNQSLAEAEGAPTYSVVPGDTLQSIAAGLWGDASLWYLIADFNGLNGSESLVQGTRLQIPAQVTNIHNNSDTFRAYDPTRALGSVSPNQVAPVQSHKHHGCGVIGQILAVVVAVVVTSLTYGALTGPTTGLLGTVFAGSASAAAGSVAGQVTGLATGDQAKFSWKSVAMSALSGGIAPGLDRVIPGAGIAGQVSRTVAGNVITQGVGVATGLQSRFDWTGVAISAVTAGATAAASDGLAKTSWAAAGPRVNAALSGAAGALAGAGARSLITGTSFGDNILKTLPDIVGQTVGKAVADGIAARSVRPVQTVSVDPASIVDLSPSGAPISDWRPEDPTSLTHAPFIDLNDLTPPQSRGGGYVDDAGIVMTLPASATAAPASAAKQANMQLVARDGSTYIYTRSTEIGLALKDRIARTYEPAGDAVMTASRPDAYALDAFADDGKIRYKVSNLTSGASSVLQLDSSGAYVWPEEGVSLNLPLVAMGEPDVALLDVTQGFLTGAEMTNDAAIGAWNAFKDDPLGSVANTAGNLVRAGYENSALGLIRNHGSPATRAFTQQAVNTVNDIQTASRNGQLGQYGARAVGQGLYGVALGAATPEFSIGAKGAPLAAERITMNSGGDRLLGSMGSASINNVAELDTIVGSLREGQFAYGPASSGGRAGNIIFDPDGSISAIRHEYGHFLDDQALGFPGQRFYYENPSARVATERSQYLGEIQTARHLGDQGARRALIQDYLGERNYLVENYYTKPYGAR
jgi:YD repeat-containing protein